jgi:hypothetical protein
MLEYRVSDRTPRTRRNERIAARVFERPEAEAVDAFDRIDLDLNEVALDGSLHKAPYGGEGTGPNPTDTGKCGWKWSVAVERHGIPIGRLIDGANRNDLPMLEPTLDSIVAAGLLVDIGTLHLNCDYDYPVVRTRLAGDGLTDLSVQRRRTNQPGTLGLRCIVEAANSWWSNYGQLRPKPTARSSTASGAQPRHYRAHHRQTHRSPQLMDPT